MKKVLFLTLCVITMVFNIDVVNALACDDEDMARLRGLAEGVSYNAKFIGDTAEGMSYQDYSINFIGLTDEIYVSDSHYTFKVLNDNEKITLQSGSTDLQIYAKNCFHRRLTTITIDLPKFNEYSVHEECESEQYKSLEVCDPWYEGNINYDDFKKIINDNTVEEKTSFYGRVTNFFLSNKYMVGDVGILIIIVLIVIFVIRNRKNKLD